jgi:hypothetical protein
LVKEMERDRGVGAREQGKEGRVGSVEKELARRSTRSPRGWPQWPGIQWKRSSTPMEVSFRTRLWMRRMVRA